MLNNLITPNGNLIARRLIQRVNHVPNKGVIVLDGYGRMLDFIPIADDIMACRIRDAINKIVTAGGKNVTQPDWELVKNPPAVEDVEPIKNAPASKKVTPSNP